MTIDEIKEWLPPFEDGVIQREELARITALALAGSCDEARALRAVLAIIAAADCHDAMRYETRLLDTESHERTASAGKHALWILAETLTRGEPVILSSRERGE